MTNFKAGGQTGTKKMNAGAETMKQANDLAKKIRMNGESWLDARKRAFAELRKQKEA
jgi:membrane-bound lytic murein transglycosylase MltF